MSRNPKSLALPDWLEVDGIVRPSVNSCGRPIHETSEGLVNFWRWFGESSVVDGQGRPMVVYHSTDNTFTAFDLDHAPTNRSTILEGAYFADQESNAFGNFSMSVYLKMNNALILDLEKSAHDSMSWQEVVDAAARGDTSYLIDDLVDWGGCTQNDAEEIAHKVANKKYDGFIIKNVRYARHTTEYLIPSSFASTQSSATQIKSATGGHFDGSNPDIFMSQSTRERAR